MSRTNVHSDMYCAGAQIIPTQKEVEIPPKTAKKGPSTLKVVTGENMEIAVGDSVLKRDGKLVAADGKQIAKFDKKSFEAITAKYNKREKETTRANKGMGRDE